MQKRDIKRSKNTYGPKPINLTPSQKKQVKNMVHVLIESVIKHIDYKKKTRKIIKQPEIYIQRRAHAPHYTKRGLAADFEIRIITKKDWRYAITKCEQEVRSLPEYICLETFLQRHIDKHQSYAIVRLSEYLVKKYFQQDLSPKSITKIKNTFIKDLEMKPFTSYVAIEIFGLQLGQPKIILTKKLQIDRTTKRDLEFEYANVFEKIDYEGHSAIYRFELSDNNLVTHMTKVVTAALCLYKVGAIRLGKQVSYSDSVVYHDITKEFPGNKERRGVPIIFTKTDCKKFPDFWIKFQSFLSYDRNKIFKKFPYLDIAYDRYYDSLVKGSSDFRIVNIIMCLEALLGGERGISYGLQTRIARLLSTLGFDPGNILQDIKFAYSIRSAFVHGEERNKVKNKLKQIHRNEHMAKETILLKIQEYARIVFLIVLLYGKEKKEFIHLLTMVQLDASSLKKFERKINLMKNYLNVSQISKWEDNKYLLDNMRNTPFAHMTVPISVQTNRLRILSITKNVR